MKILVTLPCSEDERTRLRRRWEDAEFCFIPSRELLPRDVEDVEIGLGNIPVPLLAHCRSLRWLQLNSAGADAYLGKMPAGAVLTNATGAYGLAISEHMLGMLLEIMKKLHLYRDNQSRHLWHDEGPVSSIEGSTALVVGAGNIGGDFARKLHALGAYTIGIRRTSVKRDEYLDELHHMDALEELLPRADIVALCLPGTPETAGLMNAQRLGLMKHGAILLNIGRGSCVDSEALADALYSGRLGGAGLDVTDPEPLPPEHRLWSAPNAVITPHISGFYHLHRTYERILDLAEENLGHYRAGEPLRNVVDEATGYRVLCE